MRILEKSLSASVCESAGKAAGTAGNLLFLDIGTTGTTAGDNAVLVIGTAVPSPDGTAAITQFLPEKAEEEPDAIAAFLARVSSIRPSLIVTFNGDRFDLNFIRRHAAILGVDSSLLSGIPSADLYRITRPYRDFSGLPDLRETTLLKALGAGNADPDLPSGIFAPSESFRPYSAGALSLLQRSNEQSLLNLFALTPVFGLRELVSSLPVIRRAQADTYHDHEGRRTEEILLFLDLNAAVPFPVAAGRDSCFFKAEGSSALVKAPVINDELKYFYSDYRNYDYFPAEDQALHRSIAAFADKSHRVPCTRENCYTRKRGSFLPFWVTPIPGAPSPGIDGFPMFRRSFRDTAEYIEFSDGLKRSREALTGYALSVLRHVIDPDGKYFS